MPVRDWQFWVVTAVALGGLWAIARAVVPRRKSRPPKTRLTIDGVATRNRR